MPWRVAHDDFVSYLEEAEGEEQWLEMIAEKFDNLEKDIGIRLSEICKEGWKEKQVEMVNQVGSACAVDARAVGSIYPGMEKLSIAQHIDRVNPNSQEILTDTQVG